MGNALGLNGTILANSLPVPNQAKSVLPSWYQTKKSPGQLNLEIGLIHLYVGYTALLAVAVEGLSLISQNSTVQNSQVIIPTSSSLCESTQKTAVNVKSVKPGINSHARGVGLGADISPPEAF